MSTCRRTQPWGGRARSECSHKTSEYCGHRSMQAFDTYRRQLDGEVTEQNLFGAFPLFSGGRDLAWLQLPLAEVRNSVNDDPWDASTEVNNL